jgi:hypothetical protein
MSPTRTGLLEDEFIDRHRGHATLDASRAGSTEPARSTCAITHPPKMSPLPLVSAGMGMTLSTSSLSVGNAAAVVG